MSMHTRLAKLEGQHQAGQIVVWCDQPTDMPATIAEMIADGEISETDRPRCVYWAEAQSRSGSHERAMAVMA